MGLAIAVLCFSNNAAADADREAAAVAAAQTWLALVDAGKYGESWETAAAYFKSAVTKDYWLQVLPGAREPFGKLVSRELSSKTYARSLPGAPDGEYVVIQFKASFENKNSAIETVTPMLDNDGVWRVSGYFIK
jgi:hypothetical protein